MSETTSDLLTQGLTAARVGDTDDARRLLTQATEQMPDNIEAWLALAGVVESLAEKEKCFAAVLKLDPGNGEAKAGLDVVQQKLIAQRRSTPPTAEDEVTVCYRHPATETGLRCNKCNKYICPKCAVRTPVGFRCPDCIREQEDKYYSGGNADYVIAAVIAFPLSLIIAALFTFILGGIGFFSFIIGLIVAPIAAGFIAEAVRWGVRRRRSRYLRHVVIGCLMAGIAPFVLLFLLTGNLFGLIIPAILLVAGSATITARLR
jgi:hypothetical protein